MVKTSHIHLLLIIIGCLSINEAKYVKRESSVEDFDEPLYYHQMTHHKTDHKSQDPTSTEKVSPPILTPTPTPQDETGFSILGTILEMMQSFATDFGERSGFTEWWWGEK